MEPLVTIEQGTLKGSVDVDIDGSNYCSYKGIPYAKPPVEDLRFKAPVPPEKWNGVLDATKESNPCFARDMFTRKLIGTEDCLVLNVFTKKIPNDEKKDLKPVMVWIHGGGFIYGNNSTEVYSPAFLMTQDVVVVSVNYRLGMLGFLSLEDSTLEVPGNAGFKDMILSLKWIQKNIEKFGGNPKSVTIFGESAGGAAVHLLVLSPLAKGLFHKAIAQSGSALNFWATSPGCPLQTLADAAEKPGLDAKSLLQYLRGLPVEKIFEIQEKTKEVLNPSSLRPFVGVVEKTDKEPTFLAEEPIDIILKGTFNQVPFMTGFTTGEGMCFEFFKNVDDDLKQDFQCYIPYNLGYKFESEESKTLAAKIKKYYFGNEEPTRENVDQYFMLMSDVAFVHGIVTGLKKQQSKAKFPIYLYRMSIETGLNFFKVIGKMKGKGASHADDLGYLFKNFATPEIKPGSLEDISMRRFVKLWSNFATYGKPITEQKDPILNATWLPFKENELNFLDIGTDLKAHLNPEPKRIAFWNEIYATSPVNTKLF